MGAGILGLDPALLSAVARRVGTPTYVYGANLIRAQYHALEDALQAAGLPHRICYAIKANGSLAVLRVLKGLGAGADIVSLGELERATRAGFPPESIVFSGVGKTADELDAAIRSCVGQINIESPGELDAVVAASARVGSTAGVGIRVNPDVQTDTHPYTKTGDKTAKFGVPFDEVVTVAQRIKAAPRLKLKGLAMHIGSQITDVDPYRRGTVKLLELVAAVRALGVTTIENVDVGGGLGVRYHEEKVPALKDWVDAVAPPVRAAGLTLHCEPGRFLVANAGLLLTRVLYQKHAGGKDYVIVDAGMTDFVRPSHYNAYHEIIPLADTGKGERTVNIVGPICESGDFLALDRDLDDVSPGEYLVVCDVGAYGYAMASNYNSRIRPAEVLVDGDRFAVITARETYE
ncbi:MAG TPA: diaminopimelate decarboxylase, partial [Gemmatimonadales bacterium]|nr:diaminopimelate decarboxylase [Gemmatimonadales bacterium]